MTCVEILNVIALTCGANECAGSATETGLREFLPFGGIEELIGLSVSEILSGKILQGELFKTLRNKLFLSINCCCVCVLCESRNSVEQSFALFCLSIKIQSVLCFVANYIACGSCSIYAECAASHTRRGTVSVARFVVFTYAGVS